MRQSDENSRIVSEVSETSEVGVRLGRSVRNERGFFGEGTVIWEASRGFGRREGADGGGMRSGRKKGGVGDKKGERG